MRHSPKSVYIFLSVILFVCINLISGISLNKYEFDFTGEKLFSLSDEAKAVIRKYDEPITFKLFYSNKAATGISMLTGYASRLKGFLQKFADESNGNIRLEVIDPEPFSEAEDLAVSYGLKGVTLQNGDNIYLGLVATNSTDDTRIIPFFHMDRERFLEYELTRIVYDLANPKKHKIGVLTDFPIDIPKFMGMVTLPGSRAWIVLEQMRQVFDLFPVRNESPLIPDDTNAVMIAQPKEISPQLAYAIDQYVLKGGKILLMVDPYPENKNGTLDSQFKYPDMLDPLMANWGFRIPSNYIIGDRDAARRVHSGVTQKGYVDYLAWIGMKKENLNKNDIITNGLGTINFATAGFIEDLKDPAIKFDPLIQTGKNSERIYTASLDGMPDPNKLLRNFKSEDKEFTITARLTGKAHSVFPAGPPADSNLLKKDHISESVKDFTVIAVADTDILRDDTWLIMQDLQGYSVVQPNADNGPFVLNTLDYLSGGSELISLRGRGTSTRPFTVVEKIKHNAEEKFLKKEKELKAQLEATESKLEELHKAGADNNSFLKSEQQAELIRFRDQRIVISKQLREVQKELKKDIDSLGSLLKFINILLMPILLIGFALSFFIYRTDKAKRSR